MKPWLALLLICVMGNVPAEAAEDESGVRMRAAQIDELIQRQQLEQAARVLDGALTDHPEAPLLHARRFSLSLYHSRAGHHEEALRQIDQYVAYLVRSIARAAHELPFAPYVDRAAAVYVEAGQIDSGLRRMDEWLAQLAASPHADSARVQAARLATSGAKASLLAAAQRTDEAQQLLADLVAAAQARFAAAPDDPQALLGLARTLALQHQTAARIDPRQAAAAAEHYAAFLAEQVVKHKDVIELLELYAAHELDVIATLLQQDLDAGEQRIAGLRTFLESLDAAQPALTGFRQSRLEAVAQCEDRARAARRHAALLGQPAPDWGEVTWVNGEGNSLDELRGHVVLLDFFAPWSGPCIAALPQRRAWHEKYAGRGLVVIGVTRLSQHGWNPEKKRAEPVAGIMAEQEQAALAEFAAHHRLRYRLAVVSSDTFANQYGVSAIPQIVLIDRQGRVQLVRVGAGPPQRLAIEERIEALLNNEPPVASHAAEAAAAGREQNGGGTVDP